MPKLVYLCVFNTLILSTLVQTWDIAIGVNNQIEFFKENGSKVGIASQQFEDVRTITYDSPNQTLYFADNKHDNVSIFAFHMRDRMNIEHVVKKNINHKVLGIAVDPVSEKLFWTVQSEDSIFWMSLRSNNSGNGRVFLKLEGESPQHIVVDSCRGTIYWTNLRNANSTIESASIDGKNRKIIVEGDLFKPTGITIHQGMKRIFWSDKSTSFKIEGADLDGGNRKLYFSGYSHQPYHIAVSKKNIYWTDWTYRKVWMLPFENDSSNIAEFRSYGYNSPTGIIVNNDLLEQTENVPECAHLHDMIMSRVSLDADVNIKNEIVSNVDTPQYVLDFCKDIDESNRTVKCKSGVSRYPYMLCYNYCFNGTCFIDGDNLPKCRCHYGFSGDRCQNDVCLDHCLNNGTCSVDTQGTASCKCSANWTGDRCDISKSKLPSQQISCTTKNDDNVTKNVRMNKSKVDAKSKKSIDALNYPNKINSSKNIDTEQRLVTDNKVESEPNKTEGKIMREQESNESELYKILEETSRSHLELMSETQCLTVIICLSLLCLGFFSSTVVLAFKVIALKKRPRINKRFVVNKNVTPLTSRPQCEVTIENCCNMNICETPCFEPSDLMEQVQDVSQKEEKKNLLLNMQHSDDTY